MTDVLRVLESDSPGEVRLLLDPPVGRADASEIVVCHDPKEKPKEVPAPRESLRETEPDTYAALERDRRIRPYENAVRTIHAAGQRVLDVPEGCAVTFPDGTSWKPSRGS